MIINKTIVLNKPLAGPAQAIAKAKREFLKEVGDFKQLDFCKHYILLKGPVDDDLVIIHHYIDQQFKLSITARKCTDDEHTEYLKKKWAEEPSKKLRGKAKFNPLV